MLPAGMSWPLDWNVIRRNDDANTFGMVRNKHTKPHQGWDLLAYPGTRCYAIADGEIGPVESNNVGDYGKFIILKFGHRSRTLFAAYVHLSMCMVKRGQKVVAGEFIGLTGNTGNAVSMKGADQHLHFEIRTIPLTGKGLGNHIDPKEIYGFVPLHDTIHDPRSPETLSMGRTGLKMPGFNI